MSKKVKQEAQAVEEVKAEVVEETVAKTEAPKEESPVVQKEIKPEAPKENLMYVGDTIPGVVRHSTVYADGVFTPAIDKCIEACPLMVRLFVRIDDIPEALKKVKEQYSPLYVINKEVVSKFIRRN